MKVINFLLCYLTSFLFLIFFLNKRFWLQFLTFISITATVTKLFICYYFIKSTYFVNVFIKVCTSYL